MLIKISILKLIKIIKIQLIKSTLIDKFKLYIILTLINYFYSFTIDTICT